MMIAISTTDDDDHPPGDLESAVAQLAQQPCQGRRVRDEGERELQRLEPQGRTQHEPVVDDREHREDRGEHGHGDGEPEEPGVAPSGVGEHAGPVGSSLTLLG
jgi:hypothetical protein